MARPLTVPEIITQLGATASKNDKIDILKANADNKVFRLVVEKALDPFVVYYMKQVPEHKFTSNSLVHLDRAVNHLDKLATRQKTGDDAKRFVQQILSQLSEADGDVVQRVLTKDLKVGVAASTVNKAWGKGTIPEFNVMLCSKYTEKNIAKLNWPCAVQEKMDGMRVMFKVTQQGVDVLSRSGKDLGLSALFRNELFHLIYSNNLDDMKGYMVDGELLVKEKDGSYMARKKANGILNKAIKGTISEEEKEDIYAVIWDILPANAFNEGVYDGTCLERYNYLAKRHATLNTFKGTPRLNLIKSVVCTNIDDAMEIYKDFIANGSEGVVIKSLSAGWKNNRVPHHIKVKVENETELVIKEVIQGEGKYLGKLGSFVCESSCGGLKVNVGSGFSDAEREEYFSPDLIDKIITVKFNEVISAKNAGTKSLFLPIFVKVRHDKKNADSLKVIEKK